MSAAPLELVLSRLEGVRRNGEGYMALCPAHPDRDPSLSIKEGDNGGVLLHCFAGCESPAVVEALGLQLRDLFPDSLTHLARPRGERRAPKGKGTPGPVPGISMEELCATSGLRGVCMGGVAPQTIEWLWAGRVPLGKITLLVGDPGQGKTTLALDLAARVTTGTPFPDGTEPPMGDVVVLTAEDGLADTIRPRLDAAGADPDHVWALQAASTGKGGERSVSLTADIEGLEKWVNATEAALVIIDPLDAYLQGVDTHRNAEVRTTLAPLAAMLERTGAAAVLVHHLNKDASTVNALYRAGGSLAFVAAARAVHGVAPDPDNEGRYLFLPIKLNIARKPEGMGYRLSDGVVLWDSEPVTVDATAAFSGPKPKRADSDRMTEAKDFILALLGDGRPVLQAIVEEQAEAAGISVWTLRKAKSQLTKDGIVRSKLDGFGPKGAWSWMLTETDGGTE